MSDTPLQLAPKTTAVVLIDLQNGIIGRDIKPYNATEVVERSKQIADAFRAKGSPIVFVHVNLSDFLSLPTDEPVQIPKDIPAAASDIVATAGMQTDDLLVTKRHWGAFADTSLEKELRARGVETIVITGVATNMGVESTVRQGTGLGFSFVVVEDACSTFSPEMQDFAFQNIFPRLGKVRTTAQVLAAIA